MSENESHDGKPLQVCRPCRLGKRKCDGHMPCARCVARGGAEDCVPPEQKKRGRPPKVPGAAKCEVPRRTFPRRTVTRSSQLVVGDDGTAHEHEHAHTESLDERVAVASALLAWTTLHLAPQSPTSNATTIVPAPPSLWPWHAPFTEPISQVEADRRVLLVLLARVQAATTIERPRAMTMTMGVKMSPNFLHFETPKLYDRSGRYDPALSALSSVIVASGADGALGSWCSESNSSAFIGLRMTDLMVSVETEPADRLQMWRDLATRPSKSESAIRRIAIPASSPIRGAFGVPVSLRSTMAIFVDGEGHIEWIYVAAESVSVVSSGLPPLEEPSFASDAPLPEPTSALFTPPSPFLSPPPSPLWRESPAFDLELW